MLNNNNIKKKILYVPRNYLGSKFSAHTDIVHPDPIYIKHQYQLFSYINKLNHEALIKPHPDTIKKSKKIFYNLKFLSFCLGNIKSAIKKKDILIFDSIMTTALYDVIESNVPIVLIDLNEHDLNKKTKYFIKKRCAYIDTKINKENNIVLDINILSKQINKSVVLRKNKEFAQYVK